MAPIAVTSRPIDQGYQPASQAEAPVTTTKQFSAASKSSRSSQKSEQRDRFYGYRETSELCEQFILYLFACPLDSTSASVTSPAQDGTVAPRLSEFIAYALYRTRLPEVVTYQALYLLLRLKIRFPAARGSSGHRLFISALMLASKSSCDDTYSNKSWTIVGQGLFSLREINQMERELFGYLGYKVNVGPRELELFSLDLQSATNVGQFDYIVRSVLDASSRRESLELGSHSQSHHASSPASSVEDVETPVTPDLATAVTPTSVKMVKSASYRHERSAFPAPPPTFIHPFVKNARDRNRPYSMPAHSIPLNANSTERAVPYASSPAASACSPMSYTNMSSSALSATPSPCASRDTISGRTTPDTPPSDMDASQWDDTYYYTAHAGLNSKIQDAGMISPMSTTVNMKHAAYPVEYAAPPSYAYSSWRA